MKKTLIITLEFPPIIGGIATYVHDLASVLDPEQTIVLAPRMSGVKNASLLTWDNNQPYKIIRKNLLFPRFLWPRWMRLVFQVRKIVKKEGIELIMIHHVLPVGYVGVIMKKWFNVQFLLFSHGTDLVAGTKNPWKKHMVAVVSRHAEQIIFNSRSLKRRYLQVLPEFALTSMVVYPCPNNDFLTPPGPDSIERIQEQYGLHGKDVMLSISRLDDGKGLTHLLRMIPEILKQVPYLVWLVIGDGRKKEFFIREVQKHNLQNVIRFLGEKPHQELKPFYYLSDVFALLTHPDEGREEGLGLVFLEAAACGIPVVAGKSGGVEEAVLHTQTGIVVDIYKGDPSVIENISSLFKDKAYAKKLGVQAKQRIESEFRWEKQVELLKPWIGTFEKSACRQAGETRNI